MVNKITKKKEIVSSEEEFKKWFIGNYKKLGYSKIIRKDIGVYPDFIMLKDGKEVRVELETLLSNFVLHKHNPKKVDEVVCIKKNISLNVPVLEVIDLSYSSKVRRISATVEPETKRRIEELLKDETYRNSSHVTEDAIKELWKEEKYGSQK